MPGLCLSFYARPRTLISLWERQNSDIKRCIDSFKQKSGYWLYKNLSDYKWQKDYYDHILRKEEEIKTQIDYILNNPIRAGLVEEWRDYKFKGSTVYSLDEWE